MHPGEAMAREALATWEKNATSLTESMTRDPRTLEIGGSLLRMSLLWKRAFDEMIAASFYRGFDVAFPVGVWGATSPTPVDATVAPSASPAAVVTPEPAAVATEAAPPAAVVTPDPVRVAAPELAQAKAPVANERVGASGAPADAARVRPNGGSKR